MSYMFRDARWRVQMHIYFALHRRHIPYALEISLWLTGPKSTWYWVIGFLIKIGVLDP